MAAADYGKPILVFSKSGARREPDADDLLKSLNVKYDSFATPAQLSEKLRRALGLHLLELK